MVDKARKIKKPFRLSQASEILESISDAFYALDREWRYTYVNQRGASLLGFKPEDLIGQNIWEKFPQLAGSELEAKYRQAMEKGRPQEFEMPGPITGRWQTVRVYPSREGISIYRLDINERKKAEEALEEAISLAQRRVGELQALISSIQEGVTYYDKNGNYVSMNDAAREIYAARQTDTQGDMSERVKKVSTFGLDGHRLTPEETPVYRSLKKGEVVKDFGVVHTLDSGLSLYTSISSAPIRNNIGEIIGAVSTMQDITKYKMVETALAAIKEALEIRVKERTQELAEANNQLKQYGHRITQVQEEERKRIAYELHDDTAQYLSILKLEIESLIYSGKIQSRDVLDKLEYLKKDAERAYNDVRRYSHELRPGVLEHLGLRAALEQIADDINKLKQITVDLQVDGNEPEISEEVKLSFFRIAQEALNNSRKHSRSSQVTIHLEFSPNRAWMMVSDDGVGFNKKEAYGKSGSQGSLGLMSMWERAQLINADLKIESAPGKGTRVVLESKL